MINVENSDSKKYNIAIAGATGLVGRTFLQVLHERNFPIGKLRLLASGRSAGKILKFGNSEIEVEELNDQSFNECDIALFSAGGEISRKFAPIAARSGCIVVDNSSAWRQHELVPLIVPEVNPKALKNHNGIIANPNCSTIQLVVALKPLSDMYNLHRVVISTYQAIGGAGQRGLTQFEAELRGETPTVRISTQRLAFNTVFHEIKNVFENSFEEQKMQMETRKILDIKDLPIAVTCVRVPVRVGHGIAACIEFEKDFEITDLVNIIAKAPGVEIVDSPDIELYPTPLLAEGKDAVYVGRIRRDDSVKSGVQIWIVADNVRKGAATNAVQIAELIVEGQLFNYNKNVF